MERLVGNKAPSFSISTLEADGETFGSRKLEDYAGKWLVILFYPMDFTFVCPTELTSFSKMLSQFSEENAEILSVSTDSVYSHLAWVNNGLGKLGYPMGADQNLKMSNDYGVLLDEGIALRGLFVIDPNSVVRFSVIHDNNIGRNPEEVFRVLCALKTDGLCGAGWSVGNPNLVIENKAETKIEKSTLTDIVKVYSLPDCSYCASVKELLEKAGVKYINIDLSTDKEGQAFMENRGYSALPVTVIGTVEISGCKIPQIKKALAIN